MSEVKDKTYKIEDEHIELMSKFYNKAKSIYYKNNDAFFNKLDPKYKELHEQVYKLFEKMCQVVIKDFKLPDPLPPDYTFGFPVITLTGCGPLASFQHYIPDAEFGFCLKFADYTFIHESKNLYQRVPYGYLPMKQRPRRH